MASENLQQHFTLPAKWEGVEATVGFGLGWQLKKNPPAVIGFWVNLLNRDWCTIQFNLIYIT